MIVRLSYFNIVCFIGIVEWENRIDIVINFYYINGEWLNFDSIFVENISIDWINFLSSLFDGVCYLYDSVKIFYNDIKLNNVVLDGFSLVEVEVVLIDFGKVID